MSVPSLASLDAKRKGRGALGRPKPTAMAAILVVILLGLAWYSNPTPKIASAPRRLGTDADAPSTSRRTSASLRTVESQFVQGRDGAVNDERGESLIEIRR